MFAIYMPDNIFFTETLFERRNNIVWGSYTNKKTYSFEMEIMG